MLTLEATPLDSWMHTAFRGDVPEEIQRLLNRRETASNVLTEMMTQWPSSIKEPMEHLLRLQQVDNVLLYAVIENLFVRHLEQHP